MEKINLKTNSRVELVDITASIQKTVGKSGIREGVCVVFCPHTTAGLTINENADPAVKRDISVALSKLVPAQAGYAHAEGNADSHIKASFFGASLNIIIDRGQLQLGTWQGIMFCEGDGPRAREIWVKIIGAK